MTPYWLILIFAAAVTGFVVSMAAFLSWVERKQSAVMQDRIGANRATILGIRALGLFHAIADPVKLLLKEDFVPRGANRFFHTIAQSSPSRVAAALTKVGLRPLGTG